MVEDIHWRHYCEQVDDLEMPSIDQANFYMAAVSTSIAFLLALIGVVLGTSHRSPWLVAFLTVATVLAAVATIYFKRAYDKAKSEFHQPAKRIARHMREVAEVQIAALPAQKEAKP